MRISTVPVVGSALFVLLGVFVEPALPTSPPWNWQNPTPNGSTLRSVTFLDANTVIVVGDNGAAVRSNNAGLSWINIDTATGHYLHDVSFADPLKGWIGSQQGLVFTTSDGGITWSPMTGPSTVDLADVSMLNAHSTVITSADQIFLTGDGGTTWQAHSYPQNMYVGDHWAFDLDRIVVVGAISINASYPTAQIYLTTDGGMTWTSQFAGSFQTDLRSISFSDDMNGTAVGWPGNVVHTIDGGMTWSIQTVPTQQSLNSVVQLDPMRAIAVGEGGRVIHTSDGGNTWVASITNTARALSSVASNGSVTLAVGEYGTILRSTDDGASWQQISTSFTYSGFQSIWFVDAMHGTAVGEAGQIFRTHDGGLSWTPQSSGLTSALYDVRFTDLNNGTIVGNDGYILRTVDGGSTWTRRSRDTNLPLYAVAFDGPTTGYIGGTGSLFYKTIDGGATWTKLTNAPNTGYSDIATSAGIVTMACGSRNIVRTVDGGATFTVMVLPWTTRMNALYFFDANTGVAVGESGTIVRTTDGGATWTRFLTGSTRAFAAVSFGSPLIGTAVGDQGEIRFTTDGGVTWKWQFSGAPALGDVQMTALDTGTIVGSQGLILRMEPQAPVPVLISSFQAKASTTGIELTWAVYSDEFLEGFRIYRREGGSSREVAITPAKIRADARSFIDKNAQPGVAYEYTLIALAESGPIRSAPASATMPALEARLFQNIPNPFNPTTSIEYDVPTLSPVTLRVFSLDGRMVRTLANRTQSAGRHEAVWDGTDESGNRVASGLYFYRLTVGKTTLSRKMLLLK